MWIYFNEGVRHLKIPVLTTYLRTFYKLQQEGYRMTRDELIINKQKPDTLSKHLKAAKLCGLLRIIPERYKYAGGFKSLPNLYIVNNPTHKIWITSIDDINNNTSYHLQELLGKEHTAYYQKQYKLSSPIPITIERVDHEDYLNNLFSEELSALGVTVVVFNHPLSNYLYNGYYVTTHEDIMIRNDLLQLFHVKDRYTIVEIKQMLQTVYNNHSLNNKAKSTDLALFGVKAKRAIISKNGKRHEGLEITEIVDPTLELLTT